MSEMRWKYKEGLAMINRDGKYGFVDVYNKEICPIKYDMACDFEGGLAKVYLNNKLFYLTKEGKECKNINDILNG